MGKVTDRSRGGFVKRGGSFTAFSWLTAVVFSSIAMTAAAGETVRGIPVTPLSGTYLVFKDVNVRAKPATKGKRIGKLGKGDRVAAIGKATGAWMAVALEDGRNGFVFAPMLLPLIDGELDADIEGTVIAPEGMPCRYAIRFEGKSPVENGLFETSDYEVTYRCTGEDGELEFLTYMFITEAPYQLSANHVYQISIDVTDVAGGYDEILSTVFLYEARRDRVVFDSVSLREFRRKAETREIAAENVARALAGAVELAPRVWNDKVWRALATAR